MGSIRVLGLSKRFGSVAALANVDLQIDDGEFAVLVGPSGCGKSTLLRILAGLESPSEGSIEVDGEDVTAVSPSDRDMAFVFQSYALYPHMKVSRNIAFPLLMKEMKKWHHLPLISNIRKRHLENRSDISSTVQAILKSLGIEELADRYPRALSGGQRQRVALGRAIIRRPNVFLMDEPLSNLDAKLRTEMRAEISRLHGELGTTFVYVTHDQVEAMTMATRIYVMRDGVIQQSGKPQELFDAPTNAFVARFLGNPPMNLLEAFITKEHHYRVINADLCWSSDADEWRSECCIEDSTHESTRMLLGIRPEEWVVEPQRTDAASFIGEVKLVEFLGSDAIIAFRFKAGRGQPRIAWAGDDPNSMNSEGRDLVARTGRTKVERGDLVQIRPLARPKIFDYATGRALP